MWTTERKKKKISPVGCDEGGLAVNRVSRRLIIFVYYVSVIGDILIMTIVFFFQENISNGAKPFALVLCLHAC